MTEIKPHGRRQPLRGGDTYWGRRRRAVGLSQRQVQARTGLSRGVLSGIESGRVNPTIKELEMLTDLYDAQVQSNRSSDQTAG